MKISVAFILVIYAAFAVNVVTGFSLISDILDLLGLTGNPKQPKPEPQNRTTMSYIRKQWEKLVAPYQTECMCESHVKPGTVKKFYENGKMSNDPRFKCQLKCHQSKLGVMSSTGEIDAQRWADVIPYLNLQLAQKCANIVEANLCEKSYLAIKCVDNSLSKQYPP